MNKKYIKTPSTFKSAKIFPECEAGYLCQGGEESEVKTDCEPGGYCPGGKILTFLQ